MHCEALVRLTDKDRYLAGLYASAGKRAHLYALYAFAQEIARISDVARQPLAGEMRLQWWRDALAGERPGEALANPVAAALLTIVRECALPTDRLVALIDARGFDLYDEPMPSLAELDAYAERTAGTVFALGARILCGADGGDAMAAASSAAGIACEVAQRLRTFARDAARRQIFVPLDLLAQHAAARAGIEARHNSAELRGVLAALRDHARAAFARSCAAMPRLPTACAPAFLTLVVVPLLLARLDRAADPFTAVEVPQWRRQWAIWRAARRWPVM
jgi:15-cis-phytoene synthase